MAYTIPSDISRMALAGAHSPELETLSLLKNGLCNDYTVFHGVHWTREYRSGAQFGEIDFVVLNRSGEVLFIEQKDGALEKFKWQHGRDARPRRDCLIHLPGHRLRNVDAAGVDARRGLDAASGGKSLFAHPCFIRNWPALARACGQGCNHDRRTTLSGTGATAIDTLTRKVRKVTHRLMPVSMAMPPPPPMTMLPGVLMSAMS